MVEPGQGDELSLFRQWRADAEAGFPVTAPSAIPAPTLEKKMGLGDLSLGTAAQSQFQADPSLMAMQPQPVAQAAQPMPQAVAQPVVQQQPKMATAPGVAPIPVPQTAAADPREAAARNQALLAISGTQQPQMSIQQLQARASKIDMGSLAKIEQASFRAGVENSPEILYRALDMFEQFGKNAVFPSGWGTKHIDTARNKLFDRYIAGQKTSATGRKGSVANQFKLANFFRNYANDIGRGAARWDERTHRQYNTWMKAMRLQMERGKYPHALKTARITAQMRQAMYDGQLAYWKREFPGQVGARVEKYFTVRWKDFNNTLKQFRQSTAQADMPQITVIDLMRTGRIPDWAAAIRHVGSAMKTAGTETAKAMGYQWSLMDQLADANAIHNSSPNDVTRQRLDTMAGSMAKILSREGKKVTGAQVLNAVRQQGGDAGFTPAQR